MANKKTARRAFISSVISLILCCSMLVGTTFAWFTDEVTTGMNTIAAGNLDVELLNDGTKVNSETKLFADVTLWEPGVVLYENLQVANVGTLALKYRLTLNFGNENDLNGHKLSEVLKIVAIDKVADNATREEVLAAAKAKLEELAATPGNNNNGALGNFFELGELEPKTTGDEKTFVIFWEPNADEIDNLYNANNGQITSDGQPLHIEFGVKLEATQKMYESDSFGNDYDDFADILPMASVNNLGAITVPATTTFPNGTDKKDYALDVAFQFLPNETYDAAQSNGYRYWHADYVVKADRDVPANSMALAGYYSAFCDDYNNGNWVVLSSDQNIAANTELRLVDLLGGGDGSGNGSIFVNYEEICQYGNDGKGFQCGVADLTGANAGTTITVELRLYETTVDPATGTGNKNVETDHYEVVGKYSYTFPAAPVTSTQELKDALASGDKDIDVAAGTYTFPASDLGEGVTLYCEEGTVFDGKTGLNIKGATVVGATFTNDDDYLVNSTTINGTFKDCVFTDCDGLRYCYAGETVVFENCVFDTDFYGVHFDGGANDVVFKNCTFTGFNTFGSAITKLTMEDCTFKYNGKGGYNGLNLWGNSELSNCTFVFDGSASYEWVDLCNSNQTVTFTNCVVTDGTNETPLKDVVGNYGDGNTIIIDGVTVDIPNMS